MANNIIGTVGIGAASVQPDWNQNDPKAKNYVKNRPGGYTINRIIEWDGNTDGLESVDEMFYKVSSQTFERSDIKSIEMTDGEKDISTVETESDGLVTIYVVQNRAAIVVAFEDKTIEGITITKGTYFAISSNGIYVTKLVLGFNMKIKKEYISKPDDAVGSYCFGMEVDKKTMLSAIDDFRNGKAIIMWHNELVCGASYYDESGKTVITIVESDGYPVKYDEISTNGRAPTYNKTLGTAIYSDEILISSNIPNSKKKFKITVDDTGTLKVNEVT